MRDMPLVSVIIPAYNCARLIPETLESLFAQDYPNLEIVVVNDGSKDNTLELLKSYGDRIQLVDQANTGAPGARNKGIQSARGEFIGFCDADDIWAPGKVSAQVRHLQNCPDVGMVFCDWQVWDPRADGSFEIPESFRDSGDTTLVDPANSGWIYTRLLLDCICLTSTVMFRRTVVEKVGFFDTNLWNGDDYDYWLRTSRITRIDKLGSKLVLYRILPQSVARTPTSIHYEYKVLTSAISRWGYSGPDGKSNSAGLMRNRFAGMRFGFGYLHYYTGDPRIAMAAFRSAICHKPWWHLPWAYLLLALWKSIKSPNSATAASVR